MTKMLRGHLFPAVAIKPSATARALLTGKAIEVTALRTVSRWNCT
jgi:hypothetical protein